MKAGKTFRWLLMIVGGLVIIVLLGGYFLLRSAALRNYARHKIEAEVTQATGGHTQIGSLDLSLSTFSLTMHDVVLRGTEARSAPPLLHLDALTVGVKFWPLLHERLNLSELQIRHPVVQFQVNRQGVNNLPNAPAQSGSHTSIFDLAVSHFSITNGKINYQDQSIPLEANVSDLQTSVAFHASDHSYSGSISYGDGQFVYGSCAPLPHSLRAEFSATDSRVSLRSAVLRAGSSTLSLHGDADDLSNPTAVAEYDLVINGSDLKAMLQTVKADGDLHFGGTINYKNQQGRPLLSGLRVDGRVESGGFSAISNMGGSNTARLEVRRLSGTYQIANGNLQAKAIDIETLGGRVLADVQVQHLDSTPVSHLKAEVARVSLASLQQAIHRQARNQVFIAGTLSGTADAAWSGGFEGLHVRSDLTVRGDAKRTSGNPEAVPVEADIHSIYDGPTQTLVVRQTSVRIPSLTVNADGKISRDSKLQIHAQARDLNQFAKIISAFGVSTSGLSGVSGSASLDTTVQGSLQKPQLSGRLLAHELRVEGTDWKTASLTFNASPSRLAISNASLTNAKQGHVTVDATVALRDWSLFPNAAIHAKGSADRLAIADLMRMANLHYPVSGDFSGKIAMDGTEQNPSGSGSITISNAHAYGEAIQTLALKFQAANGSVNSTLEVGNSAGSAKASVSYVPATTGYKVQLDAKSITLQKLQTLQGKSHVTGSLSLSASGEGTVDNPQLNFLAQISSLQVDKKAIGELKAEAHIANRRANLTIDSQLSQAALHMRGQVELAGSYETDATIDTGQMPLGSLLSTFSSSVPQDLAGQTELHATLKGPLKDTSRLQAHLKIPSLKLSYRNLEISAAAPIMADYAGSVLTLQPAEIRGTDTSLRVQGSIPLGGSGTPSLTAQGSVDMRLLQFLEPGLESSGSISLDVRAAGSAKNPAIQGQIKVQDVAMTTAGIPLGLENMNGTLNFTNDRVQISKLTGELGGGEISLGGAITYRPDLQFALALKGNSVRLLYPAGLRTMLDSNLSFTGNTQASSLTGRVLVDSLSFTPDFDLATFGDQFSNSVSAPTQPGFADTIRMAVVVQSKENLSTTSSQVSVEGNLNLNVSGTAANPVITGRTNLTSGELFYRNNRYQLQQGVITFADPNQTQPNFNLSVATTVEQYKLTISLRGTLDKLTTSYVSDPPLATADIIHLMAFGNTTSESAANSASQSTDAMLANSALGAGASGGIQKLAGVSSLQIDPLLGGSNQNPGARIALQQRVTKNFLFTFSTDVSQPGQELVQGDYQINPRWSVTVTRDQLGGVSIAGRLHTKP